MGTAKRFEDLEIWRDARRLANELLDAVKAGRFERLPWLADDLSKNAVRVMNNIAEGFELGSDRDFARMLRICRSTLGELRSELCIAGERRFIEPATAGRLAAAYETLSRRVTALATYLERHELPRRPRGTPAPDL